MSLSPIGDPRESDQNSDPYGILEGRTAAKNYEPSEKERTLLTKLESLFEDSAQNRQGLERNWELARLYMKGQQNLIRNRTTGDVYRLPVDNSRRLLSVQNIIRPTARTLLGKLTRTVPMWVVTPPTGDYDEIQGAKIADSFLYYHYRRLRLARLYIDVYRDVCMVGTAVIKLEWDREAGKKIAFCPECKATHDEAQIGEACPECEAQAEMDHGTMVERLRSMGEAQSFVAEMGEASGPAASMDFEPPEMAEVPALEERHEGDIVAKRVDYRDFFLDTGATGIDDAQWCCLRVATPVNEVRSRFPDKAKYITAENGLFSIPTTVLFSANAQDSSSTMRSLENHVYLFEFHERPTKEHPKGRVIWKCNNIILAEIEDPYQGLERLPFYVFYWEKNNGEFWGEGFVDQAWTLQRELNLLLTALREHRELTLRQKMLVGFNSGISAKEIDTTPGQIIFYNPLAGMPKYLEMPAFPSYTYNEIDRLIGGIRSEASVTEQEAGIVSGDASGRFAAIMEAQAAEQVGPILKYNSEEWTELGRGIMVLGQAYYTPDRSWTVTGQDMPKTHFFRDLNFGPGWDIAVQEDDSLSVNHALRLQQAIQLLQVGAFTDPKTGQPDYKMFSRVARLKLPGIGPDTDAAQHAAAASFPERIAAGEQIQPQPWDKLDVWIDELQGWLRTRGLTAEPSLVQKVGQLWLQLVQLSAPGQEAQYGVPGAQPVGGGRGSPVSTPGSVGNAAATGTSGVLGEAQEITGQADLTGELTAKGAVPHEG